MTLICIKCQVEMRVTTNGHKLISMLCSNDPVSITSSDLHECPVCLNQVAVPAKQPLVEHFQPLFKAHLEIESTNATEYWMNNREKQLAKEKNARLNSKN